MTEIIWQESEVEAIDDIDDSEGESCLENAPHKFCIDIPGEMDFFCHEIVTQEKSYQTPRNK